MRRFIPFVVPMVVVLLWIGLMTAAYRSGRLPKLAGIDWRARFDGTAGDVPLQA
jgi:hypothetical protein